MNVVSTRGTSELALADAIAKGQADDGGLYMPPPNVRVAGTPPADTLVAHAEHVLTPFFEGDRLAPALGAIVRDSLTFAAPTVRLDDDTELLELFHGPTAAFKDFGARFLASCLSRLFADANDAPRHTVLVATSGDTGAAVAAAFWRRQGFRVVVLYPDGRVSPRQAHQLGAFGDNVTTFRVDGTFDDCQRLVKAAFQDRALSERYGLVSANSISLGRLLPQMTYYAHTALGAANAGRPAPHFIVPTGNLGNAFACLLAKQAGLPIGNIVLATNQNRVLPDFLQSGHYQPQASIATLANAMDVGAPSNLERLRHRFAEPSAAVRADWVDDATIRATIRTVHERSGMAICPHTACGVAVRERLRQSGEDVGKHAWIVAATAHAAKFAEVVEPLIGEAIEIPAALAELLQRPTRAAPLTPTLPALAAALELG